MANGKPKYKKLGYDNLLLTYTNAPKYPTPWTMWGGPSFVPGSHIGNIKLGPSSTMCPENSKVSTAQNIEQQNKTKLQAQLKSV